MLFSIKVPLNNKLILFSKRNNLTYVKMHLYNFYSKQKLLNINLIFSTRLTFEEG